jgi:nitroimidazol reductase NimA-like FMN-containing flavoprotein (pyridoxamine 5'-phosphate oxidase superfamily)
MTRNDKPELSTLSPEQCWELITTQKVGRLAVSINNHPDIFPVNYRVADRQVYFQTAAGLKLAAAVLSTGVAFEVDTIDNESETGWSIVVKGPAIEVDSVEAVMFAEDLHISPWAGGPKERYIRIDPVEITGRMIA